MAREEKKEKGPTDQPNDRPTDRSTDRATIDSRMQLAKSFPDAISEGFLSSSYCRWNALKILLSGLGETSGRRRPEVLRETFCQYSWMRLAKSFFLPLIAAGMRSKFCRPASGGRPADVGQTSVRRSAAVLRDVCEVFSIAFGNLYSK